MEQTLQSQYNLIKEGKGNKAYFLKSAYRLFPDMLSPVNTFEDTVKILKNRSIISEGVGGLVTTGKKQDWHAIFNENMTTLKEEKEKEEPSKEVLDVQKHAYDNKDEKNYDNIFGEEFLKGYYTEMKDPKNADKDVEELRAIAAKNLAKDISHYVKNGQFGVKGIGYQTEAPGLGEPKEPKGKFKSSGYGDIPKSKDLKESILRSQIQLLIKEVLSEISKDKAIEAAVGDIIVYKNSKGEKVESAIVNLSLGAGDPLPTAKLKNGDTVSLEDAAELRKKALNEAEKPSKAALTAAEELYDELGSVKKAINALPEKYKEHKKALEAHLNFKFRH